MDKVRAQYEKWTYPAPIEDLEAGGGGGSIGEPRDFGDLYWPAAGYRDGLNILVAGCGANQAARYALRHPAARITGIDLSETSLAHEEKLKARHKLENLTLRRMRLEDVAELGETFDFIACSGVLHHLPEPLLGLKALGSVLDTDGVIFIMLYARYGRAPVYMMQELFRVLGATEQSDEDLALVKATLPLLSPTHPLATYAKRSQDMKFDAGLVDLFLHKQDRPYTVGEALELTADAGLAFQGWLEPMYYNPDGQVPENNPLFHRLQQLDDAERWKAVELLGGLVTRHDFCVCRQDRPERNYRIDFGEPDFPDRAIPLNRRSTLEPAAGNTPATLKARGILPLTLPPALVAIFGQVDGQRTIRECLEAAPLDLPPDALNKHGLNFFRSLWRTGHIHIRLKGTA